MQRATETRTGTVLFSTFFKVYFTMIIVIVSSVGGCNHQNPIAILTALAVVVIVVVGLVVLVAVMVVAVVAVVAVVLVFMVVCRSSSTVTNSNSASKLDGGFQREIGPFSSPLSLLFTYYSSYSVVVWYY